MGGACCLHDTGVQKLTLNMLCPFLTSPDEGRPQHYVTKVCHVTPKKVYRLPLTKILQPHLPKMFTTSPPNNFFPLHPKSFPHPQKIFDTHPALQNILSTPCCHPSPPEEYILGLCVTFLHLKSAK